MRTCPNCRNQITDDALFCPVCGNTIDALPKITVAPLQPEAVQPAAAAPADPFDHTKQFAAIDISDNKIAAMLAYLLGPLGILIALLASKNSAYADFHIRQAMKLTIAEVLGAIGICMLGILMGSIRLRLLPLFMIAVFTGGFLFLHMLCFFQVCSGKAVDIYLIRNLRFLK